ncbi:glycoside hydrolase family 43 protein [Flaviaesturariibacter amylovorans]
MRRFLFLCAFTCLLGAAASAQPKKLGELWFDSENKMINAHGGGMLYHKNTYYWFGEFKGTGKDGNLAMDGVSCYSSRDLVNWKNEGMALKMIADTNSLLQPGCVLERPKVIYNAQTKKFVMWFHHELKGQGYSAALTGLAIADNPSGPYRYVKSLRPNRNVWPANFPEDQKRALDYTLLKRKDSGWQGKVIEGMLVRRDFEKGQMSRDMTLFVDDDGTAYHVASSEDNQTLHVSRLTEDYTGFTGEYHRILPGQSNEAPAIFRHRNKYYLVASGTTGWDPNPGRSFVATSLYGPWHSLGNPVRGTEQERATTFRSQSTYVLKVAGKKDAFVYLGDRWTPDNAAEGKYIWLPITFEDEKPVLYWKETWPPE